MGHRYVHGRRREGDNSGGLRECRRREFERMREKLENEANGGRKRDRKTWWCPLLCLVGGLLYGSLKEIEEILNRQEAKCKGVNDAEEIRC